MCKFPRNHRQWATKDSEGDLVHSTAPKESLHLCHSPQMLFSLFSKPPDPRAVEPRAGYATPAQAPPPLAGEDTPHTCIHAGITQAKQMKEAATIVSVTCLGYNRPCIYNMGVFWSSFSIFLPVPLSFFRGKNNNLFFRESLISLNANVSHTNFIPFLPFVLLPVEPL